MQYRLSRISTITIQQSHLYSYYYKPYKPHNFFTLYHLLPLATRIDVIQITIFCSTTIKCIWIGSVLWRLFFLFSLSPMCTHVRPTCGHVLRSHDDRLRRQCPQLFKSLGYGSSRIFGVPLSYFCNCRAVLLTLAELLVKVK